MNRYAASHPEDYEQRLEALVDEADRTRKEWPRAEPPRPNGRLRRLIREREIKRAIKLAEKR